MTDDDYLAILRLSRDGDDLSPRHLKLLETCVNGFASEAGVLELERVLDDLKRGSYPPNGGTHA